jgi:V8-like Glu-specific endopeptidase
MGTPQQIARQYLADKKSFYERHQGKNFQQLTEAYVGALKALVQNCYVAAESSSFAKQHSLLDRMGQINWGQDAACTGLSVGSATYVLTARHCFEKLPNQSDLWFKPAMSNDRYQICAISQSNALTADKTSDISQDQVLVRIAPGLKEPGELKVMLKSALRSIDDQKAGDSSAPTLLTQISYMPLANMLFPTTFPSGFVQGKAELCAAKQKDQGCFSHLCSTESGGSGSALFVTSEPVLTLAGTHIGESETEFGSKTSNNCEESFNLNVATYINKNFLEFFPKTVSFIGNQ